ncbi:MAG: hypothetical protein JWR20_1057 [Marmoricola sp.]|nr:hypothetical protein [Marmoricola sp.]
MPEERPGTGELPAAPDRLPPHATTGLLEYLSSHAVDEDYAFVSERRGPHGGATGETGRTSQGRTRRRRVGPWGAVAVAAFVALLVVAGLQTRRGSTDDRAEQRQLARQVATARTQLASDRARVTELRRETAQIQRDQLSSDTSSAGLRRSLTRLRTLTGTVAVTGPGVVVVADNAPGATSSRNQVLDSDLQKLVNGFWQAGAEAIAIDDQRLTTLSTIRLAGGAITVNAHSLRRPYVVTVVGDRNTLPARFAETSSGQAWLDLQRQVGLRLTITPQDRLSLPGLAVSLRYARQTGSGTRPAPARTTPARPSSRPSKQPSSSPSRQPSSGGTP